MTSGTLLLGELERDRAIPYQILFLGVFIDMLPYRVDVVLATKMFVSTTIDRQEDGCVDVGDWSVVIVVVVGSYTYSSSRYLK